PGIRTYDSSFLPAKHQGTPLTVPLNEKISQIENLRNLSLDESIERKRIDFTQRLGRRLLEDLHGDATMVGMIANRDLAFRMQTTTPELVDLSKESHATFER
ncbi:MAG: DUF1501 domain-containing protein, partial [Pirellulaceae bacterium]